MSLVTSTPTNQGGGLGKPESSRLGLEMGVFSKQLENP